MGPGLGNLAGAWEGAEGCRGLPWGCRYSADWRRAGICGALRRLWGLWGLLALPDPCSAYKPLRPRPSSSVPAT